MLPFINCFFMWYIKNRLVFLLRVARSSEFFIGTKNSNISSKWFWSNTYIWCYQLCSEQNLYYVLHLQVFIYLEHVYFESYTVFKNDLECEWFVIKKKPSKTILIEQQEIYTLCLSNKNLKYINLQYMILESEILIYHLHYHKKCSF